MRSIALTASLLFASAALPCVGGAATGPAAPLAAQRVPTNAVFALLATDYTQLGDHVVIRTPAGDEVAAIDLEDRRYLHMVQAQLPAGADLVVEYRPRLAEELGDLVIPELALPAYGITVGDSDDDEAPVLTGAPAAVVALKDETDSCDALGLGREVTVPAPEVSDNTGVAGWILYRIDPEGERTIIGADLQLGPDAPNVVGVVPSFDEGPIGQIQIVAFDLAGNESLPLDVALSGFGIEPPVEDPPAEPPDDQELTRIASGCSQSASAGLPLLLLLFGLARRRR